MTLLCTMQADPNAMHTTSLLFRLMRYSDGPPGGACRGNQNELSRMDTDGVNGTDGTDDTDGTDSGLVSFMAVWTQYPHTLMLDSLIP